MTEHDTNMEELFEAARAVEHWYYERDGMWVELSEQERRQADEAVIALHDALAALGESGIVEDHT